MFKQYKQDGSGYILTKSKKDGSIPVLSQKQRLEKIIENIKTLIKK